LLGRDGVAGLDQQFNDGDFIEVPDVRDFAIAQTLEGLKDAEGATVVPGIFAAVPYCVDLIGGPYLETRDEVCKAFRPASAQRPARGA
jgi:hypothetical protein